MINRSITVKGYVNRVTYDPNHKEIYGYWLCTKCGTSFFGGGDSLHNGPCPIQDKTPATWTFDRPQKYYPDLPWIYPHSDIVYVLGPNDDGSYSPFTTADIEKVKKLAKSNLYFFHHLKQLVEEPVK